MHVLEINNLKKLYGNTVGVSNATIIVDEGEIVGFVGPNGAGKSTALRSAMTIIKANDGEISIFGKPVKMEDMSDFNRLIGYIPAENCVYPKMTANEFLNFIADMKEADREKIKYLSDKMELDLSKKISTMSFGNKRKVAICSAFLGNPKLLILDEPTSGLDPLMQQRFFDLVKEERKRGCAILLSSHILSDIEKIADRVVVIKDGKTVTSEKMKDISKKSIQIVTVFINSPVASFELENAKLREHTKSKLVFEYTGTSKNLMNYLSGLDIENFKVVDEDLETMFMHYYEEGRK